MRSFLVAIISFSLLFCFSCDQNNSSNIQKKRKNNSVNNKDNNRFQANIAQNNSDENDENNEDEDILDTPNLSLGDMHIPNKWDIANKWDSFPLIDFRKFKSINNTAVSEAEKKIESDAQKIYEQITDKLSKKDESGVLDLRNKLESKHHNTQAAINGAYRYAEYLVSIDKNKAISAYEWILVTWPESYYKWDAVYRLQELQNMYLYLYAYGNYHHPDSTQISFQLSGSNLKSVQATIYKIDLVKMVEEGLNPQAPSIPDHGEQVAKWDVELTNNNNGSWFYQQLTMPKLGKGHYVLSINSNYITVNSLFSTSDVSLLTKSDDRMLLCWAKDKDNRSVKDSKILVLKAGKIVYRGNTNDSGLFVAQMKMRENDSDNLHVIVDTPYGQAISGSYYYWYSGYYRRISYAYTDRPIYRPGQKVNFKGIFRERKQDNSIVPTPGDINLIIYNQQWEKIDEQKFTMDSFGSIHGEYTIPEKSKLGQYYMQFNGNSYYSYVYFQVEEYKKPEYEVFVNAQKKNVLQGEKMEVAISSKYYFGEPVKDADVEYEIYESGYWYDPFHQENPWAWFCEDEYYYRWRPYYSEQLIHKGTGKLDVSGALKVFVDTRENKSNDLRYRVRASVIDKSRRKIDASGTFLATRSDFTIALKTDRWSYKPGETVRLEIQTQNYNRKGISVPITLKISSSRKEGSIELIKEKLVTNDKGVVGYDWVVDENGYMTVYVEAKDTRGRLVSSSRNVWVADNTWRSPYSYSGLNIELEKATYEENEEVRGIITTGYTNSWMLTTTESDRIQAYELVKLQGGVYTYNTIATEDYQPYVNIHATMMENNSLVQTTKKIVVPPTKQFLNVVVAREASYQPGQKAEYTIKITDSENKPVVGQFSFGLVDEAIYSMRADTTPDIRKAFHMENRGTVRTNSSYYFYSLGYGGKSKREELSRKGNAQGQAQSAPAPEEKVSLEDAEMDDESAGFSSGAKPLQEARVRTEFADSAVWEPNVVTDENGIAKVSFTMPDNLTTWRATIRGVSMSGKVGEILDKVITRKNLMARLECPRTFTERDQVTISGVVHNYLAQDVEAVCRLKTIGAMVLDAEEQKIILKSGEDKRVDWTVSITSLEKVTLELEALTTEESDAMRLDIPVVPYGLAVRKSDSGVTNSEVTFSFNLPASTSSDRAHLVVSVKPTLAGSMLESLEYLAGYPYGCVEQTMSRFLPSVIVAQTLQNLQMRHEKLEKELPLYVTAGTKRLVDFQHSDGGWGWWQNDATNPLMTAYVIYGFSQAQKADYAIDSNVMSRGLAKLKTLIDAEKNFESKCYMVFAYSQAATPETKWVEELYSKVDEMTDYCRALLLMMAHKNNSNDIAHDLLVMLEKNAKQQEGYCYFEGKTVRYGWTDNPIETTAYCLKAIVSVNPQHPLIPKILKWLEIKKQGKHYQSTKDTAAVVFAFSDYLAHSNELNPNYDGEVTINGTPNKISFKGTEANTAVQEFKVVPQLGQNTVVISKSGSGKVYYTAYIEYYSKEKEIPATNSGIGIERQYFQLTEKKRQDGTISYERSPMTNTINQGDIFEVELTLSATRAFDYLMLQDYIPAGCEFEKDESNKQYNNYYYYWSNKEYRDDRIVVFFGTYNKEQKIIYRLRAETPGTYNIMPARIEMMYYPEIRSNTTQNTLNIVESR